MVIVMKMFIIMKFLQPKDVVVDGDDDVSNIHLWSVFLGPFRQQEGNIYFQFACRDARPAAQYGSINNIKYQNILLSQPIQ